MPSFHDILQLDALLATLFKEEERPRLQGLASCCKEIKQLVRPYATRLHLSDSDGTHLASLDSSSTFTNCTAINYTCNALPPDPEVISLAFQHAASYLCRLQSVEVLLQGGIQGPPPYPPGALLGCTNLTSLSLICHPACPVGLVNFPVLGGLRGLTTLTLKFSLPCPMIHAPSESEEDIPNVVYMTSPVSPLSQLSNLQQLTMAGIMPEEPQLLPGGQLQRCLPRNLLSLTLKGGWGDPLGEPELFTSWMAHIGSATKLQQLRVENLACSGYIFRGVDFSPLVHLRELHCSFAPLSSLWHPAEHMEIVQAPVSLFDASDLEVFWVGTHCSPYPWHQHLFESPTCLEQLLARCPKLRVLGCVAGFSLRNPEKVHLGQLEQLAITTVGNNLPNWLTPGACPQLHSLGVETWTASDAQILRLATLTQLTQLRLDAVWSYDGTSAQQDLHRLEPLARSLARLQRLELVTYLNEVPEENRLPLSVPCVSSFTRLKQLHLACAMDADEELPPQPQHGDFLQGLAPLRQLEQLELVGLSSVDPMLVSELVERLPELRVLVVKRCKHPGLPAARLAADDMGYEQLQEELGSRRRPGFQFTVGFASQWL